MVKNLKGKSYFRHLHEFSHLYEERDMFARVLPLDLYSSLCFGIVRPVAPQDGGKLLWFETHLCSMQLCELKRPECPSIISTGKCNIAGLRLEVVFYVIIFKLLACSALMQIFCSNNSQDESVVDFVLNCSRNPLYCKSTFSYEPYGSPLPTLQLGYAKRRFSLGSTAISLK